MNTWKKIALLLAAIALTRVLMTTIGLLLSMVPLIRELPSGEVDLKTSYELIAAYCSAVTVLLLVVGMSVYRESTKRHPLRANGSVALVLLLLSGGHLVFAFAGNPQAYAVQFARSFIWLPVLAALAASISMAIPRLEMPGSQ
ncbi:MAG: hypothetical protein M0037_10660 [Betaproteobacteria bacterium]|nr:hypothetical protein [Betaproteobacteria bacterium]